MSEQSAVDQEFEDWIKDAPEIMHYFTINEFGGIIWRFNHDIADGRIPQEKCSKFDEDIAVMRQKQLYIVQQLPKFGVTNPTRDERGNPTEEYWLWFRWWDKYARDLTESEMQDIDAKLKVKADVSMYRPAGSWKSSDETTSHIEKRLNAVNHSVE